MRERATVHVLELPADRHTVRDARRAYAASRCELSQVVRRRLALHRGVGGENQLTHAALAENRLELAQPELLGPDAIERRQVSHQYEVAAAVAARLLDRHHIGGRFDRA